MMLCNFWLDGLREPRDGNRGHRITVFCNTALTEGHNLQWQVGTCNIGIINCGQWWFCRVTCQDLCLGSYKVFVSLLDLVCFVFVARLRFLLGG